MVLKITVSPVQSENSIIEALKDGMRHQLGYKNSQEPIDPNYTHANDTLQIIAAPDLLQDMLQKTTNTEEFAEFAANYVFKKNGQSI